MRKLGEILASGRRAAERAKPLPLRQGAIREAVIEVLMQADEALAPLEIRRRAASRVGRSLKPHSVVVALGQLARDPDAPVAKVGPAQYARVDDDQISGVPLTPRMQEVGQRVLAVLSAVSEPMRPTQVWNAVEAQDGESIAYDTVAGFLALAAKHPNMPVERVKQGWYRLCAVRRTNGSTPLGATDRSDLGK